MGDPLWNREPQALTMTKPHKLMHSLLRQMGFEVIDEQQVGRFSLDCYVPEVHCGFECDGKRFHAGVKKSRRDRDRDEWIFDNAGIPILRIQADALQWKLWATLEPQIIDFIDRFADTIEERRTKGKDLGI